MKFELKLQLELPFSLNLPSRTFSVAQQTGGVMEIEIDNDAYLVQLFNSANPSESPFVIGSLQDIATQYQVPAAQLPATKLRTVLRHCYRIDIDEAALPAIDDPKLNECMQAELIRSGRSLDQPALSQQADQELANLSPDQRAAFLLRERQKQYGNDLLWKLSERFLGSANRLIRWYSVVCQDFFVEEVGLHQVASTAFRGIFKTIIVDGALIYSVHHVGKIPPLAKGTWYQHPQSAIDELEAQLKSPDDPDFARLLTMRARHLLERTAHRNAIAEAAASLEIIVARAIRKAMMSQGLNAVAVDAELEKTKMNFTQRAEVTLKKYARKGVLELDPTLWSQLKIDRKEFRHQVVHSDREPSATDAEVVVERFIKMTNLVFTLL